MALAAIAAGKPVYCEKPLAPNAAEAKAMVEAAEEAGVPTFVGFNYLKNPMVELAREIVASGEIGEVWSFRGIHAEDYMTDPEAPWTWRLDPAGGAGAVADLGSHIIASPATSSGEIEELSADLDTVVTSRPVAPGSPERRPVEVDDQARAAGPLRWRRQGRRSRRAGSPPAARCTSPSRSTAPRARSWSTWSG